MGRVKVRVKGAERTIRNIKSDLKKGMDKSANSIAESGRDKALSVINENQAYFNYEVAKGFRIIDGRDTQTQSSIKLINEAPHAGALDKGVSAAEYADGGPPVQALLPWVARKMRGWDIGGGESDGSSGGDDPDPSDSIDEDRAEEEAPEIISEERFEYEKSGFEEDISASELEEGDVLDLRGDGVSGRYVVTNITGDYIDATNYRDTINANLDQMVFGGGYQNLHAYGRVGHVSGSELSVGDTVYNKNGQIGVVTLIDSDEIIVEFEDDVGTYENAIRRPTNDFYLANPEEVVDDETDPFDRASQLSSITLDGAETDGLDEDTAEALLRQFDKVIRGHNFPPASKIVTDDTLDTIDDAVRPGGDSSVLKIPTGLIEPGGRIDGIEEANENVDWDEHRRAYGALKDGSGAEYALMHQYGEYLFDNLSDDAKAYLAESSTTIDLVDGELVPSDESVPNIWKKYSRIGGESLKSYFGENFAAYIMDDNDVFREDSLTRRSRFFEVALGNPEQYFDVDVPSDWERPDYYLGVDYDGEPLRESDLPDGYSLAFERSFGDIDDFKRGENYIVQTSDGELVETYVFERLRAGEHTLERNEDLVRLDESGGDRNFYYFGGGESFRIVGQETEDYEFSQIDRGDYVIVKPRDGYDGDGEVIDTHYARVSSRPGYDDRFGDYLGEATDVVTGETVQLDRYSFYGRRETHLDEWMRDVETLEDTPDSEIPESLTTNFDPEHIDLSWRYAHEDRDGNGPVVYIKTKAGGKVHPAKVTGGRGDTLKLESTQVDEFGETKSWTREGDGSGDVEIYAYSQDYENFRSLEVEDDIIIDPSLLDVEDNPFPEDTLARATVDSDFNGVFARPWATSGNGVRINHEAFVDIRQNVPTWDAYNIEEGYRIEFTVNGETHTGLVDLVPYNKRYQVSEYKVYDETAGTTVRVDARDITSYEESDFKDRVEDAPNFLIDGTDYVKPPDEPGQAEKGDEYLLWSYREGKFVRARVRYVSDVLGEVRFEVIDGDDKPYEWTGKNPEYDSSLFPVKPMGYKSD
ncbi:hypothetical protein HRTV-19_gp16 [Halorubrum virus HRTV-19]|nr:hypothetical protein HRTV-19_gp16 [Halorubrum virus HRTV-19]UBF19471.1 hypothetical protein HRTV-23_gp16 [Halorubrum virus HRTV-23]